ncbi:MAG TPA: 1,2-phenylacetyl-CoA epoxidase subunit PaaD [Chloroflexota bacterium]|nr:1,2-phenylacetyl-CoA epoxidase subunit PaaD [Chloroflexota bacterium]
MSTAASLVPDQLRALLQDVADPEIPVVSVLEMGMVHRVDIADGGQVTVEILPTFSGCPALHVIAEAVRARLAREPGVTAVSVRFVFDPPWSSDRISAAGQEKLRSFGIAPAPRSLGRAFAVLQRQPVACPYCGSTHTVQDNLFGPTPCRSLYRCLSCRNPFERFKTL